MQSKKTLPLSEHIDVYIPNLDTWEGIMMMLRNTEGNFKIPFHLAAHEMQEGVLFNDGTVKVSAWHNGHLPALNGKYQSYSFLVECEGKRIVYSGDIGTYSDLDPIIGTGCNTLLIETGHFGINDVYGYTKDKSVEKIYFTHNGREILNFPKEAAMKVQQLFGDRAVICYDGMVEQF